MSISASKDQFVWRGPASGRTPRPFSVKLKEIFIPPKGEKVLPSASGMMLILIGLCLGLAAYNTENNILFAALSLLIAMIIMSGFFCWSNIVSARWRLETSSTFRVGEDGEVAVVVENARRRFPLFCLLFHLGDETSHEVSDLYLTESVAPGESSRLVWRYRPKKRCVARFRIFETTSSFPFGFLHKHVLGECEVKARIWPARTEYQRLKMIGTGFGWRGASTKAKGSTGELIGLRQYAKGDAPRSIHWKVSARQGTLVVKQHAAESQARYSLVVNPSRYLWPKEDVFEKMCSFVASLAEDLFLAGDLDHCWIVGGVSIKINRVADLSSFLDEVSALVWGSESSDSENLVQSNCVVFSPLDGKSVGAIVNGTTIAKV